MTKLCWAEGREKRGIKMETRPEAQGDRVKRGQDDGLGVPRPESRGGLRLHVQMHPFLSLPAMESDGQVT